MEWPRIRWLFDWTRKYRAMCFCALEASRSPCACLTLNNRCDRLITNRKASKRVYRAVTRTRTKKKLNKFRERWEKEIKREGEKEKRGETIKRVEVEEKSDREGKFFQIWHSRVEYGNFCEFLQRNGRQLILEGARDGASSILLLCRGQT